MSSPQELNTKTNYKIYTPLKISKKMIFISLKKYFKNGLDKDKLDNLKIIDLACGSGNLLIIIMESLIKIHKRFYGVYGFKNSWITGYDIDKKALNIFNNRAKELFKKYKINGKIDLFNENSLLSNFKDKYDIVLGNPPYLGEKNNREIFKTIKETDFGKKYYEGKMDYLYFFIEKGIDILNKNGVLTYITTNYWLKADYGKILRNKIKNETNFIFIEDFNRSVFKSAHGQHNIIFSLTKEKVEKFQLIKDEKSQFVSNKLIFNNNNKIILAHNEKLNLFNLLIKKKTANLGDLLNINQGIVSGYDKAFVFDKYDEKYKDYLKPFYKNKDIYKYKINKKNQFWILYLDGNKEPEPFVLEYLNQFKDRLSKRREALAGKIKWWQLQWSRDKRIFNDLKIVARQRNKDNNFALTDREFYGSADIYYLTSKNKDANLYYILGFLNSSSFYDWFYYNGKAKGIHLELYATPLKETPIIIPDNIEEVEYIEDLVKKQIRDYDKNRDKKIDQYFDQLFKK